jgi:RND family efflux transporter MFP subunit
MISRLSAIALAIVVAGPALAGSVTLQPIAVPEWKAVYGRVEARDTVPARARIGGTVVALEVAEGDTVEEGQRIATVRDDKIDLQVTALDARLRGLQSQFENAEAELTRGQALVDRGVTTTQRLDQLRTQVEVLRNQISAAEAERQVVVQQGSEGEVLAPAAGRILTVPVTRGAVVMPGEAVATVGSGGFFLRLAIPERHASMLRQGDALQIETGAGPIKGLLAKVYPQIDSGRVTADVEVDGIDTTFVNARLLVRVPIGERQALLVPSDAVSTRSGLDFVRVARGDVVVDRVVVGRAVSHRGYPEFEVLTGLAAGDEVILP